MFLDAHSVISLNEPWLIKILWFTRYIWISLLDGFCFISIQGHSRYWSDSCGEGYKVFSLHWCLIRNQNLEMSWTSEHQHTFQTQSHFLYSATELEQLKKWYSYFVASRFWSSGNQFCSGRHFKLESDKPQAITVYLSPCLCCSIQFYLNTF